MRANKSTITATVYSALDAAVSSAFLPTYLEACFSSIEPTLNDSF